VFSHRLILERILKAHSSWSDIENIIASKIDSAEVMILFLIAERESGAASHAKKSFSTENDPKKSSKS
jgi:hypothetical protein